MCVLYLNGCCTFGSRCQFLHDEYRIRVSAYEFWLISPTDNMTRVERVDPSNVQRLKQLIQLCNTVENDVNARSQPQYVQQYGQIQLLWQPYQPIVQSTQVCMPSVTTVSTNCVRLT